MPRIRNLASRFLGMKISASLLFSIVRCKGGLAQNLFRFLQRSLHTDDIPFSFFFAKVQEPAVILFVHHLHQFSRNRPFIPSRGSHVQVSRLQRFLFGMKQFVARMPIHRFATTAQDVRVSTLGSDVLSLLQTILLRLLFL